jgi:glycosyltransferase involved in cell wall biosynthesis
VVAPGGSTGTWWEQTTLKRAIWRLSPDVFFGPAYTAPLRLRCPSVLAVYDVSYYAHPEWFPRREGWRRRRVTRWAARQAHSIVTISEFSAAEITRYLDVPRSAIHLAPPGAPVVTARSSLAAREPMVLFVGSLFNRRRIPELIEAFASVAATMPEARLVLVGDNRTSPPLDPRELAAAQGIGDRVEWLKYVPDAELEALYARARVFAFLSDYEGFGMTPMEALAHGVAPVLQDTPVTREIYGDGARLVAAAPQAVAEALTALLRDDAAHQALVAAGQARLARFSWPATADRVRRALEHAASPGSAR